MVLINNFLGVCTIWKHHQYSSVRVRLDSFPLTSKWGQMKDLDYHLFIVLGMLPSGARQTRRRKRRPATGTTMIVVLSAHSSVTPTFIYHHDYLSSPHQHLYPRQLNKRILFASWTPGQTEPFINSLLVRYSVLAQPHPHILYQTQNFKAVFT